MYQEGDHIHYSKDEVKELFKENIEHGNWPITSDEYDQFCLLLSCLDKRRVDLLKEQIHIVIFSQEKGKNDDNKIVYSCYMNLRDEDFLKEKKGIIVFSPEFLSVEYGFIKLKKVFHEIAHHELNHLMTVIDADGHKKHEAEADKIAYELAIKEIGHLDQSE
jgi:hypothetical protein